MIAVGPDGIEHEFPDDTPNEVVDRVMKQNYGPPSAEQAFAGARQSDMDMLRLLSKGVSGGLWNKAVDYATGSDQVQKAAEAEQRQGLAAAIPESIGMAVGPGKFSVASKMATPLARIGTNVLEGGIWGGGQEVGTGGVGPGVVKGAITGLLGGAGSEAVGKAISSLGKHLPTWAGGPPPVPTAASVLGPGRGFRTPQQYAKADLLNKLDDIAHNATVGGQSIPNAATGLLTKDLNTRTSKLQDMGFDPVADKPIFDAITKTTAPSPIASAAVRHPFITGHITSGLADTLALGLGAHGDFGPAASIGSAGLAGHLATMYGANKGAEFMTNAALDNARRVIGSVPTTGAAQTLADNPAWRKALQALLFNQALTQ